MDRDRISCECDLPPRFLMRSSFPLTTATMTAGQTRYFHALRLSLRRRSMQQRSQFVLNLRGKCDLVNPFCVKLIIWSILSSSAYAVRTNPEISSIHQCMSPAISREGNCEASDMSTYIAELKLCLHSSHKGCSTQSPIILIRSSLLVD